MVVAAHTVAAVSTAADPPVAERTSRRPSQTPADMALMRPARPAGRRMADRVVRGWVLIRVRAQVHVALAEDLIAAPCVHLRAPQ